MSQAFDASEVSEDEDEMIDQVVSAEFNSFVQDSQAKGLEYQQAKSQYENYSVIGSAQKPSARESPKIRDSCVFK